MKLHNMLLIVVLVLLALVGMACTPSPAPTPAAPPAVTISTPAPTTVPVAGMPNPASVFCQQQGGKTEIRKDAQGGEVGYCVFPDKSECEEWAFQRGECKPGAKPTTPPLVAPTPVAKRITFAAGGTTATVQGTVTTMLGMDNYVLRVMAGQTLSVSLNTKPEQAILTIVGADGQPLITDHADATQWSNPVPATQDYVITVLSRANAPTNYTLQITVPPLVAPTPVAKRITFAAGGTTATVQGTVTTMLGMDNYVLRVMAGQTLSVSLNTKPEQAILTIVGADGQPLITDHADATQWSNPVPATQDYVITVLSRANAPTNYTLQITVPPLVAPTPVAKRITFAAGGTSTTVSGNLGASALERYVISAQADQVMTVNATSPQQLAILVIYGADGTVLISDHADATSWSGRLPKTQDYIIDVLSRSNTPLAYSVQVTIPPR